MTADLMAPPIYRDEEATAIGTKVIEVPPGTRYLSIPDWDDYRQRQWRRRMSETEHILKEHHIGAARRASIMAALRGIE